MSLPVSSGARASGARCCRGATSCTRGPFLGDSTFGAYLRELASGDAALLELTGGGESDAFAATRVALTTAGQRIVAAEADRVALAGIDRWWGGVHQAGVSVTWR